MIPATWTSATIIHYASRCLKDYILLRSFTALGSLRAQDKSTGSTFPKSLSDLGARTWTVVAFSLLLALAAALPALAAKDENYSAAVKLIRSKNYDAAKLLLDSSLKGNPTSIKVLNALGYIAEKKKRKRTALEYYRKIVLIQRAKGGRSRTAEKAREAIARLSPASGLILDKSEELTQAAKTTKDKDEKALLQLVANALQDFALGEGEITIAEQPGEAETAQSRLPLTKKAHAKAGYKAFRGPGSEKRKSAKVPKKWIEFATKRDKLPPNEQLRLIVNELQKYSYGSEVRIRGQKITNGRITELNLHENKQLTSIVPLYGLRLQALYLGRCYKLKNLAGLAGMPLTKLDLGVCTSLKNLEGLEGVPLTELNLGSTSLKSLKGLEGAPLTELNLRWSLLKKLKELKGAPLTKLDLRNSSVESLVGLEGAPLTWLDLESCKSLRSAKGLEGTALTGVSFWYCSSLKSLNGLQGLSLRKINLAGCSSLKKNDYYLLKKIPTLEEISGLDKETTQSILKACRKLWEKQRQLKK